MTTRIVFLKKKKLSKPVLFVGLPGIGLVGKICVDYFLKQFKTELIAEVYSDSFPPTIHTQKGIIEMISDQLFVFKFKGRHFLFLAISRHSSPTPSQRIPCSPPTLAWSCILHANPYCRRDSTTDCSFRRRTSACSNGRADRWSRTSGPARRRRPSRWRRRTPALPVPASCSKE